MIIDDLNSINNSGEFKTNCCVLYPEELELGKENTDKHEATFLDLDFKIKDGEFHVNFSIKNSHFLSLLLECQTGQVIYHLT